MDLETWVVNRRNGTNQIKEIVKEIIKEFMKFLVWSINSRPLTIKCRLQSRNNVVNMNPFWKVNTLNRTQLSSANVFMTCLRFNINFHFLTSISKWVYLFLYLFWFSFIHFVVNYFGVWHLGTIARTGFCNNAWSFWCSILIFMSFSLYIW